MANEDGEEPEICYTDAIMASSTDFRLREYGKLGCIVIGTDNLQYTTEKTQLESIMTSIVVPPPEVPDSRGYINIERIYKMILHSSVPMNSLAVAFTGIPACGKTTAMTKMVQKVLSPKILPQDKMVSEESKDRCLSTRNLCILGGYPFKKFIWTPTSKRYSITYFTLSDLIRTVILRNGNPLEFRFDRRVPSPDGLFKKKLHDDHMRWLFNQISDLYGLIKKGDLTIGLFQTGVMLVNGLDVGVNKGLYDFLPAIAGFCRKLVRIVFFSLDRDVKKFSECPDLSNDKYKDRHDYIVMRWRSRLSYFLHHAAAGYIPNKDRDYRTIAVGLTESLGDSEAQGLLEEAREIIMKEAKSLGIEKAFHSKWLYINVSNDESIAQTKDILEQMIVHNPKFRLTLPLRWVFLRSLIASVNEGNPPVIMAKNVIMELADTLGMEHKEVITFLETFTDFASLLYAPTIQPLEDYVIVDLKKFTDLLDKLYYPSDPKNLVGRYGIITKEDISMFMTPDLAKPVLDIVISIGMVAYIPPKRLLLDGKLQDDLAYFLPTSRISSAFMNGADNELGSIHVVIESDHIPISCQSVIVNSILKEMPDVVFVTREPINITRVRLKDGESQPAVDIDIIYRGRTTEITICNTDDSILTYQSAFGKKCTELLSVCCEAFTTQYFRGLRFNFGLKCCRGEKRYHYLYPDKEPEFCEDCKALINSKRDFWIKAAHECQCLSSEDQHRFQESSLDGDFVAKLALFLSKHQSLQDRAKKQQFIDALGLTKSMTSLQGYSGWQFYMMLILTWEKGASSKERSKEELKRIINETLDITY